MNKPSYKYVTVFTNTCTKKFILRRLAFKIICQIKAYNQSTEKFETISNTDLRKKLLNHVGVERPTGAANVEFVKNKNTDSEAIIQTLFLI